MFNHYWRLLRPKQWTKNILVLFGVLLSGQWQQLTLLWHASLLTLAFCCMASCIYILNDICDCAHDQHHPRKRYRPIASGAVSLHHAKMIAFICAAAASLLAISVSNIATSLIIFYALLMLSYSKWLKHIPLLDLIIVASGFLVRILVGTLGLSIPPRKLLLGTTFLLALFLISCKRRAECLNAKRTASHPAKTRAVLAYYSPLLLDAMIHITALSLVFCYSYYIWQYSLDNAIKPHHSLMYTIVIVFAGLGRCYYLLYYQAAGEDLTSDYFFDKIILGLATLWLFVILYALPR